MKLKQYQVDAFATRAFEGNPAAVCPLQSWLEDDLLQAIAEENNLSETAFFVPSEKGFHLRWFTPAAEVDLCGHATLAAAHIIFNVLGYREPVITFETRSGDLLVRKQGDFLQMDFPALPLSVTDTPDQLTKALGAPPSEVWAGDDYLAVFDSEDAIRAINPDMGLLSLLDLRGVIVTAPGSDVDFVSRFFAPRLGIPEDPVTGSAHCMLAPYWAGKTGKASLSARQLSRRGGHLTCEVNAGRVVLTGSAIIFMAGEITFEP
ncbi:PhzF family phenazine biosynthesis protein [Parahaliea aestuarii]|uniref:PhzF family phenazine biosynthesis protein n=1 Tax=Parahaliea aestuarii TaxID=1852021 RepID=A0A5C8ZXC6_9GAMM|nr:PhzF family phenazine biosynthesis protein [Parahaliea aestuarii]TXS93223.1 PhzF family phenazine biosynthesis protein [Parahaliea aestuarii]